ncbi:ankyrin repeat domain-containing protein [Altererythrobacter sp. MF3-039]|uniref:ankyrin repeat domain-containing protein n=1 Tax=Altererythrobacter sp. MF3-039 TaxID=3252901 RepID=UPI00390C727E
MAANRIIWALLASLAASGCAYGTIKNVPEEMIAQPEDDRDLVAAIMAGEMDNADHMIATGANIDQAGEGGVTPLIAAALTGANGLAARLLEMGADSAAKDDAGNNALAYALQQENEALVTLLVEHARASY